MAEEDDKNPPGQPSQTGRGIGEPTGGIDMLSRELIVGDVVMLVPGAMLGLYTVHSATPILDPQFPPGARRVVLQSVLTPVTAPGANQIPVVKVSGGPQVRSSAPLVRES
jgi:hypothetical protein